MKIVIPVSASDKHLLPALAETLNRFGGLEQHTLLICATLSAQDEAHAAAAQLGITAHVFDMDYEGGWPSACSNHFANVVLHLRDVGNTEPWLWMEPDMLPVATGWADALQKEFTLSNKACMGNVVPMPHADAAGNITYQDGDFMMMGCAIYPPHMERMDQTKPLIYDLAKVGVCNPAEPFDVYLRWSLFHLGRANTDLISDQWNTHRYTFDGQGRIMCEPRPYDKPHRPRGGVVSDRAVLVHGCKDGSLAELLRITPPRVVRVTQPPPAPPVQALPASNSAEAKPATTPPFTPIPMVQPLAPIITHPSRQITREQILTAIGGDSKMKAVNLAKNLGVTHAELLGAVFPYHGFIQVKGGFIESTIGSPDEGDSSEDDPDDLL